jgi:hypothetical protein
VRISPSIFDVKLTCGVKYFLCTFDAIAISSFAEIFIIAFGFVVEDCFGFHALALKFSIGVMMEGYCRFLKSLWVVKDEYACSSLMVITDLLIDLAFPANLKLSGPVNLVDPRFSQFSILILILLIHDLLRYSCTGVGIWE